MFSIVASQGEFSKYSLVQYIRNYSDEPGLIGMVVGGNKAMGLITVAFNKLDDECSADPKLEEWHGTFPVEQFRQINDADVAFGTLRSLRQAVDNAWNEERTRFLLAQSFNHQDAHNSLREKIHKLSEEFRELRNLVTHVKQPRQD